MSQPGLYWLYSTVQQMQTDSSQKLMEGKVSVSCFSAPCSLVIQIGTPPWCNGWPLETWQQARAFLFSGVMDTWITEVLFSRLTGLLCSHRVIPRWLGLRGGTQCHPGCVWMGKPSRWTKCASSINLRLPRRLFSGIIQNQSSKLRTEDVVHYTDWKALWGNVIVILG